MFAWRQLVAVNAKGSSEPLLGDAPAVIRTELEYLPPPPQGPLLVRRRPLEPPTNATLHWKAPEAPLPLPTTPGFTPTLTPSAR